MSTSGNACVECLEETISNDGELHGSLPQYSRQSNNMHCQGETQNEEEMELRELYQVGEVVIVAVFFSSKRWSCRSNVCSTRKNIACQRYGDRRLH